MTPEQMEEVKKTLLFTKWKAELALEAIHHREQMARVGETRRASYPLMEGKE